MERPILFNTEMVKAILDGRKTQTRRIIKPQPVWSDCGMQWVTKGCWWREGWNPMDSLTQKEIPINPGDILWVRETWNGDWCDHYIYKADSGSAVDAGYAKEPRWHPSIHMPRAAARIFLQVKNVRAERLQNCGNGWCIDIEKEGVRTPQDPILYVNDDEFHDALRAEMEKLWDSTIKPSDIDRYGWSANPWVWVIEFERCEKPERWCV